MTKFVEQVTRLLEAERSLLMAGRLSDLADLADRKEALLAQAPACSVQDLEKLRDLAAANQRHLSAAQSGIRAAQRRLKEIHAISATSLGYDRHGQPTPGIEASRHDRRS